MMIENKNKNEIKGVKVMKTIIFSVTIIIFLLSFSVYAEDCKREFTIYLKDGEEIISKENISYDKGIFMVSGLEVQSDKVYSNIIKYNQGNITSLNEIDYSLITMSLHSDTGEIKESIFSIQTKQGIDIGIAGMTYSSIREQLFELLLEVRILESCQMFVQPVLRTIDYFNENDEKLIQKFNSPLMNFKTKEVEL
jgi:hypothetical protein